MQNNVDFFKFLTHREILLARISMELKLMGIFSKEDQLNSLPPHRRRRRLETCLVIRVYFFFVFQIVRV